MKKLFTLIALSFSLHLGAQAALLTPQQVIESQATDHTRQMQHTLQFNEYEYIQLKKLNKQRLAELQTATPENIAVIENNYDQAVLKVLHPNVHAAYAQYRQLSAPAPAFNAAL
jgi:hypothetical protein